MIEIVIADDHKLFAQGLANILNDAEDLKVKAIFNDGRSLIDYLDNQKADIALIDLNMPHFDGYQTLKGLSAREITIKRIILTMYADNKVLKNCVEAGVDSYLLKDVEPELLIDTIKNVYLGKNPLVCIEPLSAPLSFSDYFLKKHLLSKREIEVAQLISEGHTNGKIAEKLFISTYTVETHRKNLLHKLDAANVAELVKIIVENSII